MRAVRLLVILLAGLSASFADTFGSVVNIIGGASDLVLDEARSRLYLVTETANQVAVYSTTNRRFLTPINVDQQPISAAMSLTGQFLYVTSYAQAALDVIDLNTTTVTKRISLPAKPEGVAVGADGRVLISTIGTGAGNAQNILLIYDPNNTSTNNVTNVVITPAAPTPPVLPAPSGRIYLSARSHLTATPDGKFIIGVNNPNTTTRLVFVYETSSGTVLKSRSVGSLSTVLSVSPDGTRFMAGLSLFDTATLGVLAQQNTANSLYPYPNNANFNLQANQGGSVFAPDNSAIYAAFNITPVQSPPARANVSQLLVSDPDNLFIQIGLQLAENLVGKMVISADGSTMYALSDSGFMILSMGTILKAPIAMPSTLAVLLGNDQCGATAAIHSLTVPVQNLGTGNMTASATLLQPGGGVAVAVTPVGPGGAIVLPGLFPPNQPANQQTSYINSAPTVKTSQTASGPAFQFTYNSAAATSMGTPQGYDFLIQSPQAINIPPRVRVFQNNRNAEAAGTIIPVPVGVTNSEGLVDLIADSQRQRLYIANSGMNRVEVFDTRQQQFLTPIKVGQLPHSLALSPDGSKLYVANFGGENISVVDPDQGKIVSRVSFPPIPLNAGVGIVTPSVIAAGLSGLQIVMSDGTLWQVIGSTAVPRKASTAIGTQANGLPLTISSPRQMATTPNGEYIILLAGNGYVYLYDGTADDFVIGRQIFSPIQGYYGPIAAGPRGQYYLVNGTVLNQSLTPVASAPSVSTTTAVRGGQTTTTVTQPVSAVAVATTSTFLRFSPPVQSSGTAVVTTPPSVEVVDVNTGLAISSALALEGPTTSQTGTSRANVMGRSMALSPSGNIAYVLTTSGLSIVNLPTATTGPGGGGGGGAASQIRIGQNGVVNVANYTSGLTAGSIAAIFGSNLATQDIAGSWPLPTILGNICITVGNTPLPLIYTSTSQVNIQIPATQAAGRVSAVIRQPGKGVASNPFTFTVSKFSPVVYSDPSTGQALVYDSKGRLINKNNSITRDQTFTMYAAGLGATKGGKVVTGQPAPSSPLAVTSNPVRVFFGTPTWTQAEMVVDWAGLAPGFIGLYQINGTVPGDRIHGDDLAVSISVGGVSSPSTGNAVPITSVH